MTRKAICATMPHLRKAICATKHEPHLRDECHHVVLPINIENDVRACSSCVKSKFRIKCVFLCLFKKVPFMSHNFC